MKWDEILRLGSGQAINTLWFECECQGSNIVLIDHLPTCDFSPETLYTVCIKMKREPKNN